MSLPIAFENEEKAAAAELAQHSEFGKFDEIHYYRLCRS